MSSSSADADAPATLTHPRPDVWVITLNAPPDNRLTPKMLLTLNKLVDQVEAQWRTENKTNKALGGALVITSGIRKFFSNGFVPEILMQPGFGDELAFPFFNRLMMLPLITIAALPGHCFAGGMLLALSCDFRIMSTGKGWMSMNELLIGLPISSATHQILKSRIRQESWHKVILATRYTPQEALANELVDELVDDAAEVAEENRIIKAGGTAPPPAALTLRAVELGAEHAPKVANGAWASLKLGMFAHIPEAHRIRRPQPMPKEMEQRFWGRMERKAQL